MAPVTLPTSPIFTHGQGFAGYVFCYRLAIFSRFTSNARRTTPQPDLPFSALWLTKPQVLYAAECLTLTSAACPDLMSRRVLRLRASTSFSSKTEIKGLNALCSLTCRLALGDLPLSILPVFEAASLVPIQQRPGKIQPVANSQTLRRRATKALLPTALQDSAKCLAPDQLTNVIRNGSEAIAHNVQMLT